MAFKPAATIIEKHNELCNKLLGIKADILRASKGQKAGGIRARKALISLSHNIKKLRKEIMKVRRVKEEIKLQERLRYKRLNKVNIRVNKKRYSHIRKKKIDDKDTTN